MSNYPVLFVTAGKKKKQGKTIFFLKDGEKER